MRNRSLNCFSKNSLTRLAVMAGVFLFAVLFAPTQLAAADDGPSIQLATGSCDAPSFTTEVYAAQNILVVSTGLMPNGPFNFVVEPYGETSRPAWWSIDETAQIDPQGNICVVAFTTASDDYGIFLVTIHSIDANQRQYNPYARGATVVPAATATPTPEPTTETSTPTPIGTSTIEPMVTTTPIPTETSTSVPTLTPTPTATSSPVDKSAPKPAQTATPISTRIPVPPVTGGPTLTPASTRIPAPAVTLTSTPTSVEKSTPAPTKEITAAPMVVVSPSSTPEPTETSLPMATGTQTPASPLPVPPTTVSQSQPVMITQLQPTASPRSMRA